MAQSLRVFPVRIMDCGEPCEVAKKPFEAVEGVASLELEPTTPLATGFSSALSESESPLLEDKTTLELTSFDSRGIGRSLDCVFNPFAPSPDSPCKKYHHQMRICDSRESDSVSDEEILESMYQNLLEAIVFLQTEGRLSDIQPRVWSSDACKTPISLHSSGNFNIPDTCPGAPVKLSRKSWNIDSGLRRRLF